MKTEFRLSIALCVAIGACVSNPIAYACDCIGPGDPGEAIDFADAVFVGTITRRAPDFQLREFEALNNTFFMRDFHFVVSQSWKGVTGTEVGLITNSDGGSCGLEEGVGAKMLIYASRFDGNGDLSTSGCSVLPFGCSECLQGAEDHIAEFARLGIAELELTEGADPLYPPSAISSFPICGTGIGMAFMMSTLSLIGLVRITRSRRGKAN